MPITLRSIVLDTTDTRVSAEFYRNLLGWEYIPGDEPVIGANPEWLALRNPYGGPRLSFQRVARLPRSTWPEPEVPQQLHLDLIVPDRAAPANAHERILALGASALLDRTDQSDEPLRVYADPSGHPFCTVAIRDHPAEQAAPALRAVVLDSTDAHGLAEFYRQLTDYDYLPGDTMPRLLGSGGIRLSFQQVPELPRSTWPEHTVPQQLHLDFQLPDVEQLRAHHDRVLGLGATLLLDEFDDPVEPLYAYADPAGHPFCLFVMPPDR